MKYWGRTGGGGCMEPDLSDVYNYLEFRFSLACMYAGRSLFTFRIVILTMLYSYIQYIHMSLIETFNAFGSRENISNITRYCTK